MKLDEQTAWKVLCNDLIGIVLGYICLYIHPFMLIITNDCIRLSQIKQLLQQL